MGLTFTDEKKIWFFVDDYKVVGAIGEKVFDTYDGEILECWFFPVIDSYVRNDELYETFDEAKVVGIARLEKEIRSLTNKLTALKGM